MTVEFVFEKWLQMITLIFASIRKLYVSYLEFQVNMVKEKSKEIQEGSSVFQKFVFDNVDYTYATYNQIATLQFANLHLFFTLVKEYQELALQFWKGVARSLYKGCRRINDLAFQHATHQQMASLQVTNFSFALCKTIAILVGQFVDHQFSNFKRVVRFNIDVARRCIRFLEEFFVFYVESVFKFTDSCFQLWLSVIHFNYGIAVAYIQFVKNLPRLVSRAIVPFLLPVEIFVRSVKIFLGFLRLYYWLRTNSGSFRFLIKLCHIWVKKRKHLLLVSDTIWDQHGRLQGPLPPIVKSTAFGKDGFLEFPNIRLHYVENGHVEKPLMVLLHGFGEFWFSWRFQLAHYSKYYRTVAVDLRGYGSSDKPKGIQPYQMTALMEDVKNIIHAFGKQKCVLVGHDMGGLIVYNFIRNHPEMVDKYVTLNVAPPYTMKLKLDRPEDAGSLTHSCYSYFLHEPDTFQLLNEYNKVFDSYKWIDIETPAAYRHEFYNEESFVAPLNYYKGSNQELFKDQVENGVVDIASHRLPDGLSLGSRNDSLVRDIWIESAQDIPNNRCVILPVENSHYMNQFHPDLVNQQIDDFLAVKSKS